MATHTAKLDWKRNGADFGYKNYSRNHTWTFENGASIEASAATAYLGDPTKVDPEQAFAASLSSCHMLTFLAIASMQKLVIENYQDTAVAHLEKNDAGKIIVTRVDLHPKIEWADGAEPDRAALERLHQNAHRECFLANSVTCEIKTNLE